MAKLLKIAMLGVLILLVLSFIFNSYNSNPRVIISKVLKSELVNPETFKYRIYAFGIIPIGEATLNKVVNEKINEECVYRINAEAKTLDAISLFFKAGAILDSYVDCIDFNPVLFRQKIVIAGQPGQEKEVVYNQKQGFMILAGVKRQIPPNTQDALSLLYNLKKMDFAKNKTIEMVINTNQKNYVLRGSVEASQISSGNANYTLYHGKADIRRQDKDNPYHRSQVSMWFVHEKENIPILIKVFASGFLMNLRLVEAK